MRLVLHTQPAATDDLPQGRQFLGGWPALRRAMRDSRYQVVSLDVFDTLLLRETTPELARFEAVAGHQDRWLRDQGLVSPGARRLLEIRLALGREAYARARHGDGEAHLPTILAGMCRAVGLPDTLAETFLALEVEDEAARLSPCRPLLALALSAQAAGKRVVAVSDMHLPGAGIAELLRRCAGFAPDRLMVSSDWGLTKRGGGLFLKMMEAEGVGPQQVLHVGDHPVSDFARPTSLGIDCVLLRRPRLWRWVSAGRRLLVRRRMRRLGLIP